MPIYEDLFNRTPNENPYELLRKGWYMWYTDNMTLDHIDGVPWLWIPASNTGDDIYSAEVWREFGPAACTISKVAWRDDSFVDHIGTGWNFHSSMYLSKTRDYLTEAQQLGINIYDIDGVTTSLVDLNYDGAQVDTGTRPTLGVDGYIQPWYLMWYTSGQWKFGHYTGAGASPATTSQSLNPANYTEMCSATVPQGTYRYLNFRANSSTGATDRSADLIIRSVRVDYTFPATP